MKELDVQGTHTSITIKTLNSEVAEDCFAVSGMNVLPYFDIEGCAKVTLPKLYTKASLPTDRG